MGISRKPKDLKSLGILRNLILIGSFRYLPKVTKVDDKRKRYVNPIMFNYVLKLTYLAALRKIKKKNEELQRKFEEVSQKIDKKINDQKSWFFF